jgi:hypothetical protein
MLISCLAYSSALKMEVICYSETLVDCRCTACIISQKIEIFITNNSKLTLVRVKSNPFFFCLTHFWASYCILRSHDADCEDTDFGICHLVVHSYALRRGSAVFPYWTQTCEFQHLPIKKNHMPLFFITNWKWCSHFSASWQLSHCIPGSGSVSTHTTGFGAANFHQAILYFLQTGLKVWILFESPS